ncbi:MAG: hypothetical protein AAF633_10330 [Chloroflexota bacterium]
MKQENHQVVDPEVRPVDDLLTNTGIHRSFEDMVDSIVGDAYAGVDIVNEYPGFYRLMLDNKPLYKMFLERLSKRKRR